MFLIMRFVGSVILFLFFTFSVHAKVKIITIGDSTMAEYDPSTTEKVGWGQTLSMFVLSDAATVIDDARSGRSSKSFISEGLWDASKAKISPGDYVLIQFGHNDEKTNVEGTGSTIPEFKSNLKMFVSETKAAGGVPVLFTPVVRCNFSGNKISETGRHITADGDYAAAVREVAAETGTPVVDHTELTRVLVEEYGETKALSELYASGDRTHTKMNGAIVFARLAAEELLRQNILSDCLSVAPSLMVSPSSECDFGMVYVGSSSEYLFSVSGSSLDPANGSVTITVTEGYEVSLIKEGDYTSFLRLPYENGELAYTSFYVRFVPGIAGDITGTLALTTGAMKKEILLSGTGLDASTGVRSEVVWKLDGDEQSVVSGPIEALPESWSNMSVSDYNRVGGISEKSQRNLILGGSWPKEEDEVADRYIQFGISIPEGKTFTVDNISFVIAGSGGNGMCYRARYFKSSDISAVMTLSEQKNMSNGVLNEISVNPMLELSAGEILYIRIYPWYSSVANGKTICLKDVKISGLSKDMSPSNILAEQLSPEIRIDKTAFRDSLTLTYILKNRTRTKISLISASGQLVRSWDRGVQSAGMYNWSIGGSMLNKGTYFISLLTEQGRKTLKVLKK